MWNFAILYSQYFEQLETILIIFFNEYHLNNKYFSCYAWEVMTQIAIMKISIWDDVHKRIILMYLIMILI